MSGKSASIGNKLEYWGGGGRGSPPGSPIDVIAVRLSLVPSVLLTPTTTTPRSAFFCCLQPPIGGRRLSRQLNMTASSAERRPSAVAGTAGGVEELGELDGDASRKGFSKGRSVGSGNDEGRTSSPTSVADFPSAEGGGGDGDGTRRATPGGRFNGRTRTKGGRLKRHKRGGPRGQARTPSGSIAGVGGCSVGSGKGVEEEPSEGQGHGRGDAETLAELMSAQALFRGSIPGLTSFGEKLPRGVRVRFVRVCFSESRVGVPIVAILSTAWASRLAS